MPSDFSGTLGQLLQFFGLKVFFAILCGGLIGLERELKNKSAGIKTNILICLGAALYTSLSVLIAHEDGAGGARIGDPGRIAAQIVTGVGFLGGGTIIQSRGTIMGLTTAATIWVVAAIGLCIGIGHPEIAVGISITTVLVLVGTNYFEDRVLGRTLHFSCEVSCLDPDGRVRQAVQAALLANELTLDDFDLSSRDGKSVALLRYSGHRDENKQFILSLWNIPGVCEIRQV